MDTLLDVIVFKVGIALSLVVVGDPGHLEELLDGWSFVRVSFQTSFDEVFCFLTNVRPVFV